MRWEQRNQCIVDDCKRLQQHNELSLPRLLAPVVSFVVYCVDYVQLDHLPR